MFLIPSAQFEVGVCWDALWWSIGVRMVTDGRKLSIEGFCSRLAGTTVRTSRIRVLGKILSLEGKPMLTGAKTTIRSCNPWDKWPRTIRIPCGSVRCRERCGEVRKAFNSSGIVNCRTGKKTGVSVGGSPPKVYLSFLCPFLFLFCSSHKITYDRGVLGICSSCWENYI